MEKCVARYNTDNTDFQFLQKKNVNNKRMEIIGVNFSLTTAIQVLSNVNEYDS